MGLPLTSRLGTMLSPGDHPGLSPEVSIGEALRYAAIGMEIVTTLSSVAAAPVGAEGETPPIKGVHAGSHSYTIVLHWTKES